MKVNITLYHIASCRSAFFCNCYPASLTWGMTQCLPCRPFHRCHSADTFAAHIPPPSNSPWWVLKHRLKLSLLPSALLTPSSRPPPSAHKHPDMTAHHTSGAWWVGEKENSIRRRDTHTHTHTCADIQTQRKMSITFLWAIFYCWWTAIGFMASNHEWCSDFSLCFLLALYSLYIAVSPSPIEISCPPSLLLPL